MRYILFLQFAAGFTLAATPIDCKKYIALFDTTTARIQAAIPDLVKQIRARRAHAGTLFDAQIEPLARRILSKEDGKITSDEWKELGALKDEILDAPQFADYRQYQRLSQKIQERRAAAMFEIEPFLSNRARKGLKRLSNEAKQIFLKVARNAVRNPQDGAIKHFPHRYRFLNFTSARVDYRICYEILPGGDIVFIYVGPHENFYDQISDLQGR